MFKVCVDVTCAKLQSYKFHTGFLSAMLKNILEIIPLHSMCLQVPRWNFSSVKIYLICTDT